MLDLMLQGHSYVWHKRIILGVARHAGTKRGGVRDIERKERRFFEQWNGEVLVDGAKVM
jgi:hypothetical protein